MLKYLLHFDRWLFEIVNQKTANPVFDLLLPFFRAPMFWIPLYVFILMTVCLQKTKQAFIWCIGWISTIAASDLISSRIIKPGIGRLRPCNDSEMINGLRLLVDHCGQNGSFTSSHAANHFAMAMYFYMSLKWKTKWTTALFFAWATAICYAQVYVGVHFPFDVMGGALLGIFIGYATGRVQNHFNSTLHF
jgi:undecaprenyl-diphosphatase